ncbi:hypothetical protein K6M90_28745 [Rhizobium sp. 9T]|uniref:hypothetical protein n=1 Tax=Rhizobium croatiense TaxID=2867516 RepID=UPI001C9329EB|nr:hypothetical protein [Rhizobium croatiense]MBY4611616.1 hypothetical protein [Rhizobium croatiense]
MFDIKSAGDFYAVLVEDFDDFVAEPHSARRALHCAITAFHLYEWVWGDWLSKDKAARDAMGIASRDRDAFLQWIDRYCVWFQIVQDLANGTKHFGRSTGFETMRVVGFGDAGGVGPGGKGYLVIDWGETAGDQRWFPAAHLLEVVVRFWRDFFRKYRPADDLPASRHHVD